MSGAGFLRGTMSPANTATGVRVPRPTARSSVARTDGSADVEATATSQPAASASATMRAMPGRGGTAPAATSSA
jgi:hypothetical protein